MRTAARKRGRSCWPGDEKLRWSLSSQCLETFVVLKPPAGEPAGQVFDPCVSICSAAFSFMNAAQIPLRERVRTLVNNSPVSLLTDFPVALPPAVKGRAAEGRAPPRLAAARAGLRGLPASQHKRSHFLPPLACWQISSLAGYAVGQRLTIWMKA